MPPTSCPTLPASRRLWTRLTGDKWRRFCNPNTACRTANGVCSSTPTRATSPTGMRFDRSFSIIYTYYQNEPRSRRDFFTNVFASVFPGCFTTSTATKRTPVSNCCRRSRTTPKWIRTRWARFWRIANCLRRHRTRRPRWFQTPVLEMWAIR